jgi:phosphate transport system permease protein
MMNDAPSKRSLYDISEHTKKRNAAEGRFRLYGIFAISVGLLMLLVLVTTIVFRGTSAFQQTFITLEVELLEKKLDKKGNRNIDDIKKVSTFGYTPLLARAMQAKLSENGIETDLKKKALSVMISKSAAAQMRELRSC